MSNKKGTSIVKNRTVDEVEELLLAAEDDLLLNLSLNSHLSHASSSSSPLDHDLSRRLEALKSSKITRVPPSQPQQKEKTSAAPKSTSSSMIITNVTLPEAQKKEKSKEEEEFEKVLGADLSARFAALKGSSSSKTFTESQASLVRSESGDDGDDDEEDEVEKVIQWAIDTVRLDSSSPIDDNSNDDDDDDDDSEEEDDDDEDDEEKEKTSKQRQKK
ncbi:glutamic acid-rich protein [Telopea speciosissima]|uniref:glutamic acid-rich protein n=1 Tax=Telopea speciosissima TaxID=54955 RepID=UPI001CC4EEAE|nr:glutamic acid-rich protein [Telopea speciosissima]